MAENEELKNNSNITINMMGVNAFNTDLNTQAVVSPTVNENEETEKKNKTYFTDSIKRMRRTSFQARMGRKMDRISRKLIDNEIRLTSSPVDMVRIKAKRDERSHDLISRTIISAEVMPIVMPKIESIPLRHLLKNGEDMIVPSMLPIGIGEQQYFEIYVPMAMHLDIDDLLFRIIFDEASDRDYVMALQVKELLGNIGSSSLRLIKYWVTLYDEKLPTEIVNTIIKATNKRETLQW